MTRNSLTTVPDGSTLLGVAAFAAAVIAIGFVAPFNGMSLVAVILLILSIARRVFESNARRASALGRTLKGKDR